MKLRNNKAQRRYYTSGTRIVAIENAAENTLFWQKISTTY